MGFTLRFDSSVASTACCRFREAWTCLCLGTSNSGESKSLMSMASILAISFLTFSFSLSDVTPDFVLVFFANAAGSNSALTGRGVCIEWSLGEEMAFWADFRDGGIDGLASPFGVWDEVLKFLEAGVG